MEKVSKQDLKGLKNIYKKNDKAIAAAQECLTKQAKNKEFHKACRGDIENIQGLVELLGEKNLTVFNRLITKMPAKDYEDMRAIKGELGQIKLDIDAFFVKHDIRP